MHKLLDPQLDFQHVNPYRNELKALTDAFTSITFTYFYRNRGWGVSQLLRSLNRGAKLLESFSRKLIITAIV